VAGRYQPVRATPNPPFDVSLHVGAAWIATTAVIVHMASFSLVHGVPIVALSIALAALLRRRWIRQVSADPQLDLYMLLFGPMWGVAALIISVVVATAALGGDVKPPPPSGVAVLLSVGSGLPSVWAAAWFAGAAARGGPMPLGTTQREVARAGIWRATAAALWPIQFFGVLDGGRPSVAAALTLVCWLGVAAVGVTHLAARRQMNRAPSERHTPETSGPDPYREPDARDDPASPAEEPGLRTVLAHELRRDAFALIAITVPLFAHVLLIVV
jgi:hypothetical protein